MVSDSRKAGTKGSGSQTTQDFEEGVTRDPSLGSRRGGCWLFVIGTPPVTWAKMEFCVYVMEKGLWGDSGIKSCGIGRGLLGASTGQLWGFKARGHPQ